MAVWVSPLPDSLPVSPGTETSCRATVRNDSEIVDEYAFEVLGPAAAWAETTPKRLSLMPGTTGEVSITFRPPRDSSLPPGPLPTGLKVASVERPDTSAVVEGALEILPYGDYTVDLIPRTSHGSSGGKHELAFDNRGNRHVQAELSASDPDGTLRFRFRPPALDAPPGTASFTKLQVRHRRRFLRGPAKLRPFVVVVAPEGEEPISVNGTAVQESLVPTWALAALVGVAALALLWFFVFKPAVKDTARTAADQQALKILSPAAQTTPTTTTTPTGSGSGAGSGAPSGSGSGSPNGGSSGSGSGGTGGTTSGQGSATGSAAAKPPFSKRLAASCSSTCVATFTVPTGKTLAITDILLGNPQNTKGTLTIRSAGSIVTVENLDNFRDLDFHFGTPVSVPSGKALSVGLKCGAAACSAAAFFSGTLG